MRNLSLCLKYRNISKAFDYVWHAAQLHNIPWDVLHLAIWCSILNFLTGGRFDVVPFCDKQVFFIYQCFPFDSLFQNAFLQSPIRMTRHNIQNPLSGTLHKIITSVVFKLFHIQLNTRICLLSSCWIPSRGLQFPWLVNQSDNLPLSHTIKQSKRFLFFFCF